MTDMFVYLLWLSHPRNPALGQGLAAPVRIVHNLPYKFVARVAVLSVLMLEVTVCDATM